MATADNLFNMTQNFLTPDIVQKLSGYLGQPADKVQSGLKAIVPTFLMGLVNKGATKEGAEGIVSLVKKEGFDNSNTTPGNVTDENYLHKGNEAVHGIFGNNLSSVTSTLSSTTGLNSSSVTKVMGLIAPVVMGFVGAKIKRENLNANGLMGFLGQQKSGLSNFIPAGVAGFFGGSASSLSSTAKSGVEHLKGSHPYATREGVIPTIADKKRPWTLLGLIALAVLAFLWWLTGRQTHESIYDQGTMTKPETSSIQQGDTTNANRAVEFSERAPDLGGLGAYLSSGNEAELPKRFTFEKLVFDTGTSNISGNAQSELDEIAIAMKDYPKATARIEGFTDNTGDVDSNMMLSTERANAIRDQLVGRGIAAERIEAVGLGQESPIATNETDAGRAQNRRIEFVITNLK